MGSIPAWRATDGPKFERISDLPFSSSLFKIHRQLYCPSFVVLPKASGLLKILQNLVHLAEADLRTNSLLSRILFPLRLRNPVSLLVQSREPRHQELQKVRVFPCTSSEIIAVAEFGLYHVVQRVKNSAGAVVIRRQAITRFTSFEVFSQPRSDDHFNRGH